MASHQSSLPPSSWFPHHPFDEHRWVEKIRNDLAEKPNQEQNTSVPVSVFSVPESLLCTKPEAYVPQLFALGPYHHLRPQLYEMESYKLATARRSQTQLRNHQLQEVVNHFIENDHIIRCHYHRQLDFNAETLAWMMAIDACFLLEFLRNYSDAERKAFRKVPSMSHMVDSARMKLAYNSILRDIVMLENQIPLFLVKTILHFQISPEKLTAEEELNKMLVGFVKEISPFKVTATPPLDDLADHAHLLQLLYYTIVPVAKQARSTDQTPEIQVDVPPESEEVFIEPLPDPGYLKKLFTSVWTSAAGLKITKILVTRPVKFLAKVPWKIISKLPGVSLLAEPMEKMFFSAAGGPGESGDEDSDDKPPLVEEIMIPSVAELTRAGVKFRPAKGDLATVEFDAKTATLYLPTVSLDVNTEVLLRNLVAYEASVESGPMVFTRYTELINGIIDTEEDVKLLREKGIILNRMKSDGEVAKLWNGMSKSVRLSKVAFVDRVIVEVNRYHDGRWSVKARKFVKSYVFGSWQLLTLLACVLLLFMTCVQAFCSVYRCGARWSEFTEPQ